MAQITFEWDSSQRTSLSQQISRHIGMGLRIVQVIPITNTIFPALGKWSDPVGSAKEVSTLTAAIILMDVPAVANSADTQAMTESAIAFLQSQGLLPS